MAFPGFGALKGTDKTAMLGPDLPETVWFYEVDRGKAVARTRSQDGARTWEVPLAPFLGGRRGAPARGHGPHRLQGHGALGSARAPITEMVDPEYTVLVKIPKSRLPR